MRQLGATKVMVDQCTVEFAEQAAQPIDTPKAIADMDPEEREKLLFASSD